MKSTLIGLLVVAAASVAYAQGQNPYGAGLPNAVALEEKDITQFAATATELNKLDIDVGTATNDIDKRTKSLAASSKALEVLERHDFTPERFRTVAYSIGIAIAALDGEKDGAKLDNARAEQEKALAAMKEQLPPEQFEMMKKQLEGAMTAAADVQNQPPGNLELVRQNRSVLDEALKDD